MKSIKYKILTLTFILLMTVNFVAANNGANTGFVLSDTMIFVLLIFSAIVLLMIIYTQVYALKALLENRDAWTKKNDENKKDGMAEKASAIVVALFLGQSLFAQDGNPEPLIKMTAQMYWLLLSLNAFLLGVVISLYFVLTGLIKSLRGTEEAGSISQISASLTGAVPIEREADILMDHDYDGIRELDNNLPPWWKYGFYLTIVVAIVYLGYYHLGGGDLQLAEYEKEMQEGEALKEALMAEQVDLIDENNLTVITDAAGLEAGKKTYKTLCQVCHGEFGEGIVGPNFTDKYWKHGGGIADLYKTIKIGIPEKGMISWESTLSPGQRLEVASYILNFQGTNPPNQKAPEGDLWEPEAVQPESSESTEEVPSEEKTDKQEKDA